jgi:cardiolipin synthase
MESILFVAFQWAAIVFLALMLVLALFEPALPYRVGRLPPDPGESVAFRRTLSALAGAPLVPGNRVEILANGEVFYPAELEAIAAAQHSINLEAYIFKRGEVTRRFVEALAERARAGVAVHVVLDAVGAFLTTRRYLAPLTDAGGHVAFYHPIRWYTLPRINNRTHRELLIVDGAVGFLGGAGFADHWLHPSGRGRKEKRWRDTMVRVEGELVLWMQATFAENWLEASGRILSDSRYFPHRPARGDTEGLVVCSSPTTGRSTRNRMLYQTLLASAQQSIHITSPYFIPDAGVRYELIRAVEERGVDVTVIVPGRKIDHPITRYAMRRHFGTLLRRGIRIYEYLPAMVHAKAMVVDGRWSVVGSTNVDHRSFGLNDEVDLCAYDPGLAAQLEASFAADLAESRMVTLRRWRKRPLRERLNEVLGGLFERQQ